MTTQPPLRGDVAVVVPAAGLGTRLGPGAPKALRTLAGVPILRHAVAGLAAAPSVAAIVVAAPADDDRRVAAMLADLGLPSDAPGTGKSSGPAAGPPDRADPAGAGGPGGAVHGPVAAPAALAAPEQQSDAARPRTVPVRTADPAPVSGGDRRPFLLVVPGGATRQESVAAALAAVPPGLDIVCVHDAARALAPAALVESVASAVRAGAAAVVPVLPVVDTVRAVGAGGALAGVVDRAALRRVQTPQGFRRAVLAAAHARGGVSATDDAGLVEGLGVPVTAVAGAEEAFKITTPYDLAVAEALLAAR
ncbi:MAG TPA: 2-C-methyl-D-erythritol 4-phosphate cytidylyltransferase [Pilimelia sp.]|nr:2-C-methyl-D-erythritol 4-phosphate cytidylyltransferase [Pilimelia sp.]